MNTGTVAEIRRLIPNFGIGYGDKEIFWISAAIAGDTHAWEPYLLGSYGDCGEMLHFNPNVDLNNLKGNNTGGSELNDLPVPYFMNGQFLVEGVHFVGEGLKAYYTHPYKADLTGNFSCQCADNIPKLHGGGSNSKNLSLGCSNAMADMQNIIKLQQLSMLSRSGLPPTSTENRFRRFIKRIMNKVVPSWMN